MTPLPSRIRPGGRSAKEALLFKLGELLQQLGVQLCRRAQAQQQVARHDLAEPPFGVGHVYVASEAESAALDADRTYVVSEHYRRLMGDLRCLDSHGVLRGLDPARPQHIDALFATPAGVSQ